MQSRNIRRTLIGSASLLVLALASGGGAQAQTVTGFQLDILSDPLGILGGVAGANSGNSLTVIGTNDTAHLGSVTATLENNSTAGNLTIGSSPTPFEINQNSIYARGSANTKDNSLGVLPGAPVGGAIDGVAILQGQVADEIALFANSDGDEIVGQVLGQGDASAEFLDNSVLADASFNRTLNTIEVGSSADLQIPTVPTGVIYGEFLGLPSGLQSANLSVANLQLNTAFASNSGDPDNVLASVIDAVVRFNRIATGNDPISGVYDVSENAIDSRAASNTADNSALVTDAGSLSFAGTVIVTNLQASQDTLGTGINAENRNALIRFDFRKNGLGGPPNGIGNADGLTVTADDNRVLAQGVINTARNEVGFDPSLDLDGVLVDPITQVIRVTGGVPESVEADYAISNLQAAVDFEAGSRQAASAITAGATIITNVENVADDSPISMSGNAISAVGGANGALNLLGNGAAGTGTVDGIAASFNYQLAAEPDVLTRVRNGLIAFRAGVDNAQAFGGFAGSILTFEGNAIGAISSGNQAQSANRFSALDLTMAFTDGAIVNDGANLNSNNGQGADVENHRANGGSTILSYQELEGGDFADVPAISAEVTLSDIEVLVNDPTAPVDGGLDTAIIRVLSNQLTASAAGNSFVGVNALSATSSFTGTAATLAVQKAEGQNAVAEMNQSGLSVLLGYSTETADNVQLTVAGNSVTALASVNTATTQNSITALSFEGGADGNDNNARIFGSSDPLQIAGRNRARADSSLTTLTDQFNDEGSAIAETVAAGINVVIDGLDGSLLSDSPVTVSGNTIGAQSRGNQASNTTALTALSATTADEGAFAGILSQQVNATVDAPAIDLDALAEGAVDDLGNGGLIVATTLQTSLSVTLPATDGSVLNVNGNRILSNAAANLVTNSLTLDVGSLTTVAPQIDGAFATTFFSAVGDVQLELYDAGAFIVNSQRNEALSPGDNTAPDQLGPQVVAILDSLEGGNLIEVTLSGVGDADLTNSTLTVSGNSLLATARGNDAGNSIALKTNSGGTDVGLLSNQINSGSIFALNADSEIETLLEGDANANVTVAMNSNQIGSSAIGSDATNLITATSATGFGDVAQSGGILLPVATFTPPGLVTNNGELEAAGNLVLLNTQTGYGGVEAPQTLSAETNDATIALNATGQTTAGTYSLSGNSITATAGVNTASNAIAMASGTSGGLPSATLLNVQRSSGASVDATVSGSSISGTLGSAGSGLVGGSGAVSGNGIGATASINSGSNTIGAPGQSFSRTSSF